MADETTPVGWIVAAITGGGGLGFLVNLITAKSKSRRDGAEGSAVLINSASSYAQQLTKDNAALREEFNKLRSDFNNYRSEQEAREREQGRLFRDHTRWDDTVRAKLSQMGEAVPPAPPLYIEA